MHCLGSDRSCKISTYAAWYTIDVDIICASDNIQLAYFSQRPYAYFGAYVCIQCLMPVILECHFILEEKNDYILNYYMQLK